MTCETVRVVSDDPEHGGFFVVNREDFNPETHVAFHDSPQAAAEKTEKDELIALAIFYKIASPSILARWGVEKLRSEVDAAKLAAGHVEA